MRYLSVCSGIEAASCAWHPLGWTPVAVSEIEKFPSAVLAHHYPTVPNWGDMTKFQEWPDATIDLLVGGTPCQSFSVAGLRKGLADPRGNLALTYLAIADRYRPEWLVWENVPGVLSSGGGRDFGAFLGGLGELGYGWAYRVLDAQYFGLAQRRKRVFVVASARGWQRAAAVLFDSASLRGDPPPSREAREAITNALTERPDRGGGNSEGQRLIAATAPTLQSQRTGGGGPRGDFHYDGGLVPEIVGTLSDGAHMGGGLNGQDAYTGRIFAVAGEPTHGANGKRHQYDVRRGVTGRDQHAVAHSLRAEGFDASEDGTGRGTPLVPIAFSAKDYGADAGEIAPTLRSGNHDKSHANGGCGPAIAFDARQSDVLQYGEKTGPLDTDGHSMWILEEDYAGAYEADSSSVLSELRKKVGAEAVAEWGSRILDSLQTPEVLRSWLHGESLRRTACDFKSFVDDRPLPRQEGSAAATLRKVWQEGPDGCSSQGRGLAKQLAQQLGKTLPELPHARASAASTMQVRRLTPRECEKLQGFEPGYTDIKPKGKPTPDGPRYKALGNSKAVPVVRWIGERIQLVILD